MPAINASAPGKIILFGEHAVVYGRPAVAAPVMQVQAKVTVMADPTAPQGQVWIQARDVDLSGKLSDLPASHPFAVTVDGVLRATGLPRLPALRMQITSTIPIAAGLGSGAAVSVAMARALAAFVGRSLSDEQVSAIAYETDRQYHGTPSGIDNTVIAYAQPVFFVRDQPFAPLAVREPFTIVIGHSGLSSPTGAVVADVRRRWQSDPPAFERLFDEIGQIACRARELIENGPAADLGELMSRNHRLLVEMTVSSPELDRLVAAALEAGALGAKLSGGGRGGNMIALAHPGEAASIADALTRAGAARTLITTIGAAPRGS